MGLRVRALLKQPPVQCLRPGCVHRETLLCSGVPCICQVGARMSGYNLQAHQGWTGAEGSLLQAEAAYSVCPHHPQMLCSRKK